MFISAAIKEGRKEKAIEIANNMLKLNLDIEIIKQATSLSEEEIKKLI